MRYGFVLPYGDARTAAELAHDAEQAGWDGFFVWGPVWGLWLDDAFYFSTGHDSVKGRNLARHPAVAVHLESGDDAVMLEGRVERVADPATLARFDQAYGAKYGFYPIRDAPNPDDPGLFYALRPTVAFAWRERDFPQTATRFRFPRRSAAAAPAAGSGIPTRDGPADA